MEMENGNGCMGYLVLVRSIVRFKLGNARVLENNKKETNQNLANAKKETKQKWMARIERARAHIEST